MAPRKPLPKRAPITHWSHSSLMAYLRNPLAWYKRYVELVYDMPSTPSGIVGRAAHVALQHYYSGLPVDDSVALGLEHLRGVSEFEIQWGTAHTKKARRAKREGMEREYLQAIHFYLVKPPKHKVLEVEFKGTARVPGLLLPIKAVSDLVVESRLDREAVDIVDHKFVDSFSKDKERKTLFIMQALFNYFTVLQYFNRPVKRFMIYECKKTRNQDGRPQLRRYVIHFDQCKEDVIVFKRLLRDATKEIMRTRAFLPNPSDMYEGENSFDIYRMNLLEGEGTTEKS